MNSNGGAGDPVEGGRQNAVNSPAVVTVSSDSLPSANDMELDLPSDCFEACAFIEAQVGRDYPSYKPTGLVDAQMVAKQVSDCYETLHVATATSGLIETVEKLKTGLNQYSGAVIGVMEHLKAFSIGARDDFAKVCESKLIRDYGLPPSESE